MSSHQLNGLFNCELFFKCENFQKVGAFKFRGATNAVLSLSEVERSRGVVTHSSGNHAAALALAARLNGVKATIVMPETAPEVKKNAVKGYGAEIIFCKPTLAAREETTLEIMEKTQKKGHLEYLELNVWVDGGGWVGEEIRLRTFTCAKCTFGMFCFLPTCCGGPCAMCKARCLASSRFSPCAFASVSR